MTDSFGFTACGPVPAFPASRIVVFRLRARRTIFPG